MRKEQEASEFAKAYNEVKLQLDRREEELRTLQLENAKLTGQLDSKTAQLQQTQDRFKYSSDKAEQLQYDIEKLRKDQAARLEQIKNTLQEEEEKTRTRQLEEFRQIQQSQDSVITELQIRLADQAALLEQLSVEKSQLNSQIRYLNNTLDRVSNELEIRSEQLKSADGKFEEYRKQVEIDNGNEIQALKNNEQ
jgi:chromosome segregation ATPase